MIHAAGAPGPSGAKGWVDLAKGICIILVVMMHTALSVEKTVGTAGFLHAVVAWTKPFRMPDFFLLSGFLAGGIGALSPRALIDRRVLHYIYFYLLWLCILTVVKLASDGQLTPGVLTSEILYGLIEPFGSLWFIYVLPVFVLVARYAHGWRAWAIFALAVALHIWAMASPEDSAYAMGSDVTGWMALDSIALYLVYFLAGYLGRGWIAAFIDDAGAKPGLVAVMVVVWAVLHTVALHRGLTAVPGLTLLFGLAGGLAISLLATILHRVGGFGWLAYCGRHTLPIYLAFVIPMAAAREALTATGLVRQPDLILAIVLVLAIAGPLVLERLVRNGPFAFLFRRPDWARLEAVRLPHRVPG